MRVEGMLEAGTLVGNYDAGRILPFVNHPSSPRNRAFSEPQVSVTHDVAGEGQLGYPSTSGRRYGSRERRFYSGDSPGASVVTAYRQMRMHLVPAGPVALDTAFPKRARAPPGATLSRDVWTPAPQALPPELAVSDINYYIGALVSNTTPRDNAEAEAGACDAEQGGTDEDEAEGRDKAEEGEGDVKDVNAGDAEAGDAKASDVEVSDVKAEESDAEGLRGDAEGADEAEQVVGDAGGARAEVDEVEADEVEEIGNAEREDADEDEDEGGHGGGGPGQGGGGGA
ncbi:uncharacterized protein BXZ73DRAFT_74445 [Epithele typhae]|uniref:uncharacterized protein n=1 Tax=Epithele typhae TaxID=378194 RepID=UPI00200797A2|nr:uncharacterized protein BXZ73DRAFT_74445 [Epithele typhae]KAH9942127.1 hypothetical protein BXZ73DRAFT_74445 [Epithele typhae]